MRLSKEDYNNAVGCLKRYDYNCINILNIKSDIYSIETANNDGQPKPKYNKTDTVLNKIIQVEENEAIQKAIKEYKAVRNALLLVNKDCEYIFEKVFREQKSKWEVINEINISERTFERRKKELIYGVHKELKKSWRKIGEILLKKRVIIITCNKYYSPIKNVLNIL